MGGAKAFVKSIIEAAPESAVASLGSIEHWIDIEIIQKLVRHSVSVVVALVAFWLVGVLLRYLLHEGYFKKLLLLIDDFVQFALLAFLGWEIIFLIVRRLFFSNGH